MRQLSTFTSEVRAVMLSIAFLYPTSLFAFNEIDFMRPASPWKSSCDAHDIQSHCVFSRVFSLGTTITIIRSGPLVGNYKMIVNYPFTIQKKSTPYFKNVRMFERSCGRDTCSASMEFTAAEMRNMRLQPSINVDMKDIFGMNVESMMFLEFNLKSVVAEYSVPLMTTAERNEEIRRHIARDEAIAHDIMINNIDNANVYYRKSANQTCLTEIALIQKVAESSGGSRASYSYAFNEYDTGCLHNFVASQR